MYEPARLLEREQSGPVMRSPACKPGSVGCLHPDGHSSRNAVTRILQQPTRGVLIEVGASRRLFGLAPAGVYRAVPVTRHAVGSYPTFSPLPAARATGGLFSVALSVTPGGVPRRYLATCPWSPDFPRWREAIATVQPVAHHHAR